MALVIQQINASSDYVPYERPPQPVTLWTAIPRGLQSFIVSSGQIDVKPVNDTFQLEILATLPANFGYVMADLNFSFAQDRAADWDNECNLNLQNFYRANTTLAVGLNGNWVNPLLPNSRNGATRAIDVRQPWPSFPIVAPLGTAGALINFSAWNVAATVTLTGVANFYISFWQFDLEQIRKFPINTPAPVHSR